jgi:hypothetical protein
MSSVCLHVSKLFQIKAIIVRMRLFSSFGIEWFHQLSAFRHLNFHFGCIHLKKWVFLLWNLGMVLWSKSGDCFGMRDTDYPIHLDFSSSTIHLALNLAGWMGQQEESGWTSGCRCWSLLWEETTVFRLAGFANIFTTEAAKEEKNLHEQN